MGLKYVRRTTYPIWLIHKRTLGINKPEFIEISMKNKKNDWSLCSNLMTFLSKEEG